MIKLKGKAQFPSIEMSLYSTGTSTSPMKDLIDQMEALDVKSVDTSVGMQLDVAEKLKKEEEKEDFTFNFHGLFN